MMELCQMLSACCCWVLLNSVNLLDWWNHGGIVWTRAIVVSVQEIDQRVRCVHVAEEVGELGLVTCVWDRVSHSAKLTPASGCLLAMDVVEAEGLDDCAEGEDKTWERTTKDIQWRHHGTRWVWTTVNDARLILPRASVVCPHWKCADDAPWCTDEKKVRVCASSKMFCLTGHETPQKIRMAGQVCCFLSITTSDWYFWGFLRLESTSFWTQVDVVDHCCSWPFVILPAVLMPSFPIRRPRVCATPGWLGVRVLLWSTLLSLCLATSKYTRSEGLSWPFWAPRSTFWTSGTPKCYRDCLCLLDKCSLCILVSGLVARRWCLSILVNTSWIM